MFSFLLFSFFFLYTLVDFSVHGIRFLSAESSTFHRVLLYYWDTFSIHLDLFFTLAFLFTTLKVLYDCNHHQEFTALQMAGISKKKLFSPFVIFASLLSGLSYVNAEYFAPAALQTSESFRKEHRPKKIKTALLHSAVLADGSELVYQSFNQNELSDVFWIRNLDDIWHMKTVQLGSVPLGLNVDHFKRNEKLEKVESYPFKEFPELDLESKVESTNPSLFLYKLVTPLMPFLLLFAVGPLCMKFSRKKHLFLTAAGAIFGLITAKVILDGMLILGENQVLSPSMAILGPFTAMFSFSLFSFVRMR